MAKNLKTFKQLQREFNQKIEELQKSCKHKHLTDWVTVIDSHLNNTGVRKRYCKRCNIVVWEDYYARRCKECGHIQNLSLITCFKCDSENSEIVHILARLDEIKKIIKCKREVI